MEHVGFTATIYMQSLWHHMMRFPNDFMHAGVYTFSDSHHQRSMANFQFTDSRWQIRSHTYDFPDPASWAAITLTPAALARALFFAGITTSTTNHTRLRLAVKHIYLSRHTSEVWKATCTPTFIQVWCIVALAFVIEHGGQGGKDSTAYTAANADASSRTGTHTTATTSARPASKMSQSRTMWNVHAMVPDTFPSIMSPKHIPDSVRLLIVQE